jgi:hypothetical protein
MTDRKRAFGNMNLLLCLLGLALLLGVCPSPVVFRK